MSNPTECRRRSALGLVLVAFFSFPAAWAAERAEPPASPESAEASRPRPEAPAEPRAANPEAPEAPPGVGGPRPGKPEVPAPRSPDRDCCSMEH